MFQIFHMSLIKIIIIFIFLREIPIGIVRRKIRHNGVHPGGIMDDGADMRLTRIEIGKTIFIPFDKGRTAGARWCNRDGHFQWLQIIGRMQGGQPTGLRR